MEEIRRLQEQLQAVQLESTVQKLSERNIVGIVSKLRAMGLVTVFHTEDGKGYITPEEVEREVEDGIYDHQGRVNITTLQENIGINLEHIENCVQRLVRSRKDISYVMGEIITSDFLDHMMEEINEELQEKGLLTISEICNKYSLPDEFVLKVIRIHLGHTIQGKYHMADRQYLYTRGFIDRQRALIRGLFTAVTRPVALMTLINQYNLHEQNCFATVKELTTSGRLPGVVVGASKNSMYIPHLYVRTQQTWANAFLASNGYIGFEQLKGVEIYDYERFCRGRDGLLLESCFFSRQMVDRVEGLLEEALQEEGYCDILGLLSIPLGPGDASALIASLECVKKDSSLQVMCTTIVVSLSFLGRCQRLFTPLLSEMATRAHTKGLAVTPVANPTEQDLVKKGGKKTNKRLVKEQTNQRPAKESYILSLPMIIEHITTIMPDLNNLQFVTEIAEWLQQLLHMEYLQLVQSIFVTSTQTGHHQSSELQDQFQSVFETSRLFLKGICLIKSDTRKLEKHFLKTFGNDLTTILYLYATLDYIEEDRDRAMKTTEERLQALELLPLDQQIALKAVEQALCGESANELMKAMEAAATQCQLLIRKPDRKRERVLVANHRKELERDLENASQPAAALHLVVMLLFQKHTQCLISAPAACVPQLVTYLKPHLSVPDHTRLVEYQRLIINTVGLPKGDSDQLEAIQAALDDGLALVKALPLATSAVSNSQV